MTSGFTTDGAEEEMKDMQVQFYLITHTHTRFNKSLIAKVVMNSYSLESVLMLV